MCALLYQTAVQDEEGKPRVEHLNPLGFKIALELMVKCAPHRVMEVCMCVCVYLSLALS